MANKTVSTEAYARALRRIIEHLEHVYVEEKGAGEDAQTEGDSGVEGRQSPVQSLSNQRGIDTSRQEEEQIPQSTPSSLRVRTTTRSGGGGRGNRSSSK
nr:TPA_asm: X protein [Wuhan sharpbelly bornavirus]